jgi:hypothetical protein
MEHANRAAMAIAVLNIRVSFTVERNMFEKRLCGIFVPRRACLSNKAMRRRSMTSARHRNKTCELRRKHGTTLIGTRRPHHGPHFADAASWQSLATTRHHQDADKVKSVGRQPHRSSVATYKTFVIGGLLGRVEF